MANRTTLALFLLGLLCILMLAQSLALTSTGAATATAVDREGLNRKLLASRELKFLPLLIKGAIFIGKKAAAVAKSKAVGNLAAVASAGTAVGMAVERSQARGQAVSAQDCGAACAPPPARPNINGCESEDCLCSVVGAGVHPNFFDNTCSTFFHCPGPKRPCGPGTLFNPEFNVCDWPANVRCVRVSV